MANRRTVRFPIYPALLLAFTPGCQAFHVYRPVTVRAVDADTKKPIPGAEVRVCYPLSDSPFTPWESSGTAGDDGLVRLRAAPYGEAGINLEATAKGYLGETKNLSAEAVQAIEPAGFFEAPGRRPVSFVVEMYAGPDPAVELVLPDGYRGPVKVAVEIREDAPCPAGQRLFSYVVPPTGVLRVVAPPLLRRVFSPDYRARYADGTALPRLAQGEEVGFWCVKTEGGYEHFLVGTLAEYEARRRADASEDSHGARSSGGGKGGGRGGRRGRGGNSPPSDSGTGGLSP